MMAASTVKEAIRSGDVDALDEERLEELGFKANSVVGDDGFTLVHWACHFGRAEVSCLQSAIKRQTIYDYDLSSRN
jgi:hypothetical protein